MTAVAMPRRGTGVAAALILITLVAISAVTYYRSWSLQQLAAGGWPPQQPLTLLTSKVPVATLEVSRQLYTYLETPTAWCRRLQVLGGSCPAAGAVPGHTLLCRDDTYGPQSGQCLIYTFDVTGEWSFARDAARHQCEVHALDPSMKVAPTGEAAAGVKFHQLGLAGKAGKTELGEPVATLSEIKSQLGHGGRVIDYLKVDVQGSEWDWLERDGAALADVRQLGMRVYLSLDMLRRYHRLLWQLHQQGFRLVYTAPDSASGRTWEVAGVDGKVAVVYDLVWINRRRCSTAFGCGD